jgi:hypothetical protein
MTDNPEENGPMTGKKKVSKETGSSLIKEFLIACGSLTAGIIASSNAPWWTKCSPPVLPTPIASVVSTPVPTQSTPASTISETKPTPTITPSILIPSTSPSTSTTNPSPSPEPILPPLTSSPNPSPLITPSSRPKNLETKCASKGYYESSKEIITVANQPEQPIYKISVTRYGSLSISCKIIENSGELNLAYALPDDSKLSSVSLQVHIDGVLKMNTKVSRGEIFREKIDISRAKNGYKIAFYPPQNINYATGYVYELGN